MPPQDSIVSAYSSSGSIRSMSDHGGPNAMNRTTEGWLELFLTTPEKLTFSNWREDVKNRSLTNQLMDPLFQYLATFLPHTVAPNVVALYGPLSLGHAWYLVNAYGDDYPTACTWLAVVSIITFWIANSICNIHADNMRQRTALGELFKYSCDAGATVFLSILTVYCLGGVSVETQWYSVQISQLVLFLKHLSAFHRHAGLRYNVLAGPGEVILMAVALLAVRATLGLDWLQDIYAAVLQHCINAIMTLVNLIIPASLATSTSTLSSQLDLFRSEEHLLAMYTYYTIYIIAVTRCLMLQSPHGWSRFGLSASLLMRFVPAVLFHLGIASTSTVGDVICDGFFLAVLTSDVTLSKMAGRELHPWVCLMSMATVLSHTTILTLCVVYYIAVFADLSAYLNMPLLTTCRNVYCDGVYDLCHVGHKNLFQKALQHGNRLFVGVVGDADAQAYKRPPIMTHDERCAEVNACKAVTKVIPNCPCFGLTKEFLDEHQIHVVAYGMEYLERYPNPKDDPYYRVPREMGIAWPLPRTEGLSTSELIRRIQCAAPADDKKSPT